MCHNTQNRWLKISDIAQSIACCLNHRILCRPWMKSIPICIPIISRKIDVVHRREYCVFCGCLFRFVWRKMPFLIRDTWNVENCCQIWFRLISHPYCLTLSTAMGQWCEHRWMAIACIGIKRENMGIIQPDLILWIRTGQTVPSIQLRRFPVLVCSLYWFGKP